MLGALVEKHLLLQAFDLFLSGKQLLALEISLPLNELVHARLEDLVLSEGRLLSHELDRVLELLGVGLGGEQLLLELSELFSELAELGGVDSGQLVSRSGAVMFLL